MTSNTKYDIHYLQRAFALRITKITLGTARLQPSALGPKESVNLRDSVWATKGWTPLECWFILLFMIEPRPYILYTSKILFYFFNSHCLLGIKHLNSKDGLTNINVVIHYFLTQPSSDFVFCIIAITHAVLL